MKRVIAILTFLLVSSCGPSQTNDGADLGGPSDPSEQQGISTEFVGNCKAWGDLACQKDQSCSSPLLNIDQMHLKDYLAKTFSPDNADLYNLSPFYCGQLGYLSWNDQIVPMINDIGDDDATDLLLEFVMPMIDELAADKCVITPPYEDHLYNYLIQTQEFKNECH